MIRTLADAEAAWQRARDLCASGDRAAAGDLVVEIGAFYERGRFLRRAAAVAEALDAYLGARDTAAAWAVLDDFLLGPGEFAAVGGS